MVRNVNNRPGCTRTRGCGLAWWVVSPKLLAAWAGPAQSVCTASCMSKKIGDYTVSEASVAGDAYVGTARGKKALLRVFDVALSDERVQKVQAEAVACREIEHGAVARIEDVVAHGAKTAVVVNALPEGASLAALRNRLASAGEAFAPEAAWHVAREVSAAMAAAHATEVEGEFIPVCHGHLSPAHIWVGFDGSVKVLGVGLSAFVGLAGAEADPAYTAPEQRDGGRITPRGDIYSVAAVLWELLTGEEPHDAMQAGDAERSGELYGSVWASACSEGERATHYEHRARGVHQGRREPDGQGGVGARDGALASRGDAPRPGSHRGGRPAVLRANRRSSPSAAVGSVARSAARTWRRAGATRGSRRYRDRATRWTRSWIGTPPKSRLRFPPPRSMWWTS